ncbi:MAG TPA: AzlD domain-containing protein [Spirochaetia bacterium]|nr:AzlD domain-containing protein [Spirochaetia bacterium]
MHRLELGKALLATGIMAAVTLLTRAAPFLFFRRRKQPPLLRFVESYIPPMMMLILVLYSLKDVPFARAPYGLPELLALAIVAVLHLWRRNALLSIFGGTLFYMFVVQTNLTAAIF